MKRTLVVGDIHGGLRALQQVMARAAVTTEDTLVFLGDYVDGWSESAQVIDFLIQLASKQPCVFIKGNHDLWCEGWLEMGLAPHHWLLHGGSSTAKSYQRYNIEAKLAHLAFFSRMNYYYIDSQNRLFVHGGFTSVYGPEQEVDETICCWDRTLWETAVSMDKNLSSTLYPKRFKLFKEIFIGHTPTLNYHTDLPMHRANIWNVDTGAAFHGKLTLMDSTTKEYWQSDLLQTLYPGEEGRRKK